MNSTRQAGRARGVGLVPEPRPLPPVVLSRPDREADIARGVKAGQLERIRRGAYRVARNAAEGVALERERRVLERIAAELESRTSAFWFSHTSAALLWGCWTWRLADEVHTVQLTPPDVPGFDRSLRRHWSKDLPERDRATLAGVPVTSLARTAVDCARLLRPEQAVVVVDSALRMGAASDELARILGEHAGRRGVRSARRVLQVADGRVESPGESLVRWFIVEAGMPRPVAAVPVDTWSGRRWVDLGWPELKIGLEFDGALKYDGTFGDGVQALVAEKTRHDALVEAGWILIRVTWDDLLHPERLAARVRAARRRR